MIAKASTAQDQVAQNQLSGTNRQMADKQQDTISSWEIVVGKARIFCYFQIELFKSRVRAFARNYPNKVMAMAVVWITIALFFAIVLSAWQAVVIAESPHPLLYVHHP